MAKIGNGLLFISTKLIEKVKPKIIKTCSKFQIRGIPDHQPSEHLFTLKSVISLYQSKNKELILTCYDLKKYFDSEVLVDAMQNLYECDIKGKVYRIIYELNKDNNIEIKTAVGMTDRFKTGENVTQGSVSGGLISSVNLDIPMKRFFDSSDVEVYYGLVRLQPLIYQDDVTRLAVDVSSAQAGNDRVEICTETKLLDLHEKKSCFLLFNNKDNKLRNDLTRTPLLLYGKPMIEKICERYLGDIFHSQGLARSAQATVEARLGAMMAGAIEIRSVVEDCRSNCLGGIGVGLDIYEAAYIPALLNNCQSWMDISEKTVQLLDNAQTNFYRILLSTPISTPKAALLWDCGGLKMKYRIMQRKLEIFNCIIHKEDSTLSKQILMTQHDNNYPGLVLECREFIRILNIPDPMKDTISKKVWKKVVKKAVFDENEMELKEDIKRYKKLVDSELGREQFGRRPYIKELNITKSRNIFKYRSSMTQHVKMNQKSNKEYSRTLWKCNQCGRQDTNSHLLWCFGFSNEREGADLNNDSELAEYLQKVFMRRNEEEINKLTQ